MSTLVLDRVEQLDRINQFTEAIRKASISEASNKRDYEKKVNKFLDYILAEKAFFQEHADDLACVLPNIEGFSWFSDLNENGMASMKEIIELMHKLYEVMRTRYIKANVFFVRNQIGTQELKAYKAVADDLKELAADLHARFFVFPIDDEFQATTDELNGL